MKNCYRIISLLSLVILLIFVQSCSNNKSENDFILEEQQDLDNSQYKIDFTRFDWKDRNTANNLILHFRIVDKDKNKKVFLGNLDETNFKLFENSGKRPRFEDIKIISGQNSISDDAIYSLIIDRSSSIKNDDIESIKSIVKDIVETLPDSTVYISFIDNIVGESNLISKDNFSDFEEEFVVSKKDKNLYHSIANKFTELAESDIKNTLKYLIVFTDGKVDPNKKETVSAWNNFYEQIIKVDNSDEYDNVIIHAFRYGKDESNDDELIDICTSLRKPEVQGNFYPATDAKDIISEFNSFIDDISADYELILSNPPHKIYSGDEISLYIKIEKDKFKANGQKKYVIGSKERPIITGDSGSNYYYILVGLVILFITFFIIQVIIPYINHKMDNFENKYVVSYFPQEEDLLETCSVCQEIFVKGEKVVTKCPHKTHWECWKENGYKCVEYGQNCSSGIQHYFDKEHPFDLKKSPYYLKWVLSGMTGGLLTWIIYQLCFDFNPDIFEGFSKWLLKIFYSSDLEVDVSHSFVGKLSGFLLTGILLGFILTYLFSYINEYRQKKGRVYLHIILRAIIGAFLGFISFLIGAIICVLANAYDNSILIDCIPWLLFGATIALCLSIKTSIKWQHALIGGIISGILSFIILLTSTNFLGSLGVMLSFMLCSAGLGISIVTVHHTAQKYFLRYKNDKKDGEIAIHKWMSVLGGSNEVTIGKSSDCIIQMNWDNSENIHNKEVKLYIDKKRNLPMLKILEDGMTYDDRETKKNNEYILKDGVKFKIGNTTFQYIEKK